jgi:hypothetical protein
MHLVHEAASAKALGFGEGVCVFPFGVFPSRV